MIRDFRPLQIVHDFCFTPIGMKQMNGWDEQASEAEKRRYITSRLSRLKSLGFGGVVINVAFDQYMEDETAWDRFLFAFDEADRLGLRIWSNTIPAALPAASPCGSIPSGKPRRCPASPGIRTARSRPSASKAPMATAA